MNGFSGLVREKRAEFLYRSAGKALFVERLRLIVRERQNEIARQLSNGENLRILEWIINRCEEKVDAKKTPVGYIPMDKDINLEGSGVSEDTLKDLLDIDKGLWEKEVENIKDFYKMFEENLPEELENELKLLESRLKN